MVFFFYPSPLRNIFANICNNERVCIFWKPQPEIYTILSSYYSSCQWHSSFVSLLPVCCSKCARWILMPTDSHLLKLFRQENALWRTGRHISSQSATYSAKSILKPWGTDSLPNRICIVKLVFRRGITEDSHKLVNVQVILGQKPCHRVTFSSFKKCLNAAWISQWGVKIVISSCDPSKSLTSHDLSAYALYTSGETLQKGALSTWNKDIEFVANPLATL